MPGAAVRFSASVCTILLGIVLVVAVFAFSHGVTEAVGTGVGCGALVLALAANATSRLGALSRWLHAVLAIVAAWTIVAARVFGAPGAVKWLSLADGVAVLSLGFALLVVHETTLLRRARRAIVAETTLTTETAGAAGGNGHATGVLGRQPARFVAPVPRERRRP